MFLMLYVIHTMNIFCLCMSFFFFKQKTAYEMRISDWSSDVCSSDLDAGDWQLLKPAILGAIMDHFASGAPVIEPGRPTTAKGEADSLVEDVTDALCRVIDPELGYNIVGLGLVYDVAIEAGGDRKSTRLNSSH